MNLVTTRTLFTTLLLAGAALATAIDIRSESAVVIEGATGKILWSKNPDVSRFPASTTKIMTAILLIENCKIDDIITAPADIAKIKEASMHLMPGEKVKMKDMLYALMLRSANDGCYAVAVHIAGSVEKFSEMMNERAKQIGCKNTHFHNPNGLNDPLHTTTALDLALMAREGMNLPLFREVVKTPRKQINRSENWQDTWMTSKNKLLKLDPTADGVKTGYTVPAGHCYVGSATRDGRQLITCVLKGEKDTWQQDHLDLLDFGFKEFSRKQVVGKGEPIWNFEIGGENVTAGPEEPVFVSQPATSKPTYQGSFEQLPNLKTPIAANALVGTMIVRDADGFVNRIPMHRVSGTKLVASANQSSTGQSRWSWLVFGGLLVGGISLMRGRSRRMISLG